MGSNQGLGDPNRSWQSQKFLRSPKGPKLDSNLGSDILKGDPKRSHAETPRGLQGGPWLGTPIQWPQWGGSLIGAPNHVPYQSQILESPGDPKKTPIDWVTPIRNSKHTPQKLTTKGPYYGDSNLGTPDPKRSIKGNPKRYGWKDEWMDGY